MSMRTYILSLFLLGSIFFLYSTAFAATPWESFDGTAPTYANYYGGAVTPSYSGTYSSPSSPASAGFHNAGTVAYVQLWASMSAYYGGTLGNPVQAQWTLFNSSGIAQDCTSPLYTDVAASLGIGNQTSDTAHGADGLTEVTIPFTGTQCTVTGASYPTQGYYVALSTNDSASGGGTPSIFIGYFSSSYVYSQFQVYDTNPSGLPPPTTTDNEASYTPSNTIATSSASISVGAKFSIGNLDTIGSYVGYEITDPSGAVVYNATSSIASGEATYSISNTYDFNVTGLYLGQAYYQTNLQGQEQEVPFPTTQRIAINVVPWTINPDGSFTQNMGTTSTTTLPELNLDCSNDWTGSLCNFISYIIIPHASSFANLQSTFNQLGEKAPFSFFTQSAQILSSFSISTSSYSSFSVTVFGDTIPLVSTTTVQGIGLTMTVRNYLIGIMQVGLWILLAWFLYWRIASIFGV